MKVKLTQLKSLLKTILSSKYYSNSEAQDIAEVLMHAEMTGKNTQGVLKLIATPSLQDIKPEHKPKVIKSTKVSVLIDGGGNPGILVSKMAIKSVIDKCKKNGFAIVGTKNTFSSTGVIGYYAGEIAKNDFVGIVMAGSPGSVAPFGGIDPLFGTNPMAFGFPTNNWPIIFDAATSAITWYGLVRAKALGQKIPEGVAIDKEGNITTDPEKAMQGAILPFDKGYKSSGLSMVIELLTGPLVEAMYPGSKNGGWGNLFIAIDPELLTTREKFKEGSTLLIKTLKKSRKAKGQDIIHIPGWKGLDRKEKIEKAGEMEVEDSLYKELKALSTKPTTS
ncbi:MAG: Ldh family oxidoreductase [bacterium]|nr:Ldh family oxidoreductase [bacterium]